MSAHTPGPWTYQNDQTFQEDGSTLVDKRIVGADRISPALVFGGIQETEANARLIVAAPDMLEALKRVRESLRVEAALRSDEYGWTEFIDTHIEPAIAKAEGKQL